MITVETIKLEYNRFVSLVVWEIIQRLDLHSYEDVYAQDERIEELTEQCTASLPFPVRSIVDFMVMDALCLHFEEI